MIRFVSAVFYCLNEKELVEAANSILHAAPDDVILLSGRRVAPIPKLLPTLTEVCHIQLILLQLVTKYTYTGSYNNLFLETG